MCNFWATVFRMGNFQCLCLYYRKTLKTLCNSSRLTLLNTNRQWWDWDYCCCLFFSLFVVQCQDQSLTFYRLAYCVVSRKVLYSIRFIRLLTYFLHSCNFHGVWFYLYQLPKVSICVEVILKGCCECLSLKFCSNYFVQKW
jgi:hypothetical protein